MADYVFRVRNSSGTGVVSTDASVTVFLKKNGTSAGSSPTIVEIGNGYYYISHTVPAVDIFHVITIDFDVNNSEALDVSQRFQDMVARPEDANIDRAISAGALENGGRVETIQTEVTKINKKVGPGGVIL